MSASIAVQILPDAENDGQVVRVVDDVIAYIQSTGLVYQVGAFETAIEGESYEELMDVVKECMKVAVRSGAPKVSAYIKAVYRPDGEVLTIAQKTGKYQRYENENSIVHRRQ